MVAGVLSRSRVYGRDMAGPIRCFTLGFDGSFFMAEASDLLRGTLMNNPSAFHKCAASTHALFPVLHVRYNTEDLQHRHRGHSFISIRDVFLLFIPARISLVP